MTTGSEPNKPRPSPVAVGSVVAGKYRVDRVIGSGGMGVVVLATHTALARKVAIKFLLDAALHNATLIARFSREARATTMIQSEHVVKILDVGALESGAPFIVMEHLEGADLSQVLRDRGALPVPEVIEYVLQACEAIAEAHACGIVHRDLKPANLFLSRRADGSPCLKVLDFGVSKLAADDESMSGEVTHTQAMVGSPAYMAPEQIRSSRTVDARADIWALGAVLHKLLTGRGAFAAPSTADITVKVLTEPAPRLRAVRPDIPQGLDDAVARCLEKDVAARFQNVAELARALCIFGPRRALASANRIARVLGAAENLLDSEVPPPPGPPPAIYGAGVTPCATTDAASSTSAFGAHATSTAPSPRRLPGVVTLAAALAVALSILAGLVVFASARLDKRAAAMGSQAPPAPPAAAAAGDTEPHSAEPAALDGAAPEVPPAPPSTYSSPSSSSSASAPSAAPRAAEPRPRRLPTGVVPGRPAAGYNDGEFGGRK